MQPLPDGIHHSPFSHNITMRIRSPTTTSTSYAIQNTAVGFSFVADEDPPRSKCLTAIYSLTTWLRNNAPVRFRTDRLTGAPVTTFFQRRDSINKTVNSSWHRTGASYFHTSASVCVRVFIQSIILYCPNTHQLICCVMKPYINGERWSICIIMYACMILTVVYVLQESRALT